MGSIPPRHIVALPPLSPVYLWGSRLIRRAPRLSRCARAPCTPAPL